MANQIVDSTAVAEAQILGAYDVQRLEVSVQRADIQMRKRKIAQLQATLNNKEIKLGDAVETLTGLRYEANKVKKRQRKKAAAARGRAYDSDVTYDCRGVDFPSEDEFSDNEAPLVPHGGRHHSEAEQGISTLVHVNIVNHIVNHGVQVNNIVNNPYA